MRFDFYGVRLDVAATPAIAEQVRRDFSYFHVASPAGTADVEVQLVCEPPPWYELPDRPPSSLSSKCLVYDAGDQRFVDYHGEALARWSYRSERGTLWCERPALLHELAYLLILSRIGELLDRRGIHRLHAFGVAVDGKAALLVFPSGGGKTTLGLRVLRDPRVRLLSDDTPLVTRTGDLLAFPVRIGSVARPPYDDRFLRHFERRENGPKWLVDIEALGGRIAPRARPGIIVLGERRPRRAARAEPLPRRAAAGELFRSLVVGLGLPQVIEFFLRLSTDDVMTKAGLVASRTAACAALLARSQAYRLTLARDSDANAQALLELLTPARPAGTASPRARR
jgi:hypothetical protein